MRVRPRRLAALTLVYLVLILLAAELLPPILYGNVCDGLREFGASCVTYFPITVRKSSSN